MKDEQKHRVWWRWFRYFDRWYMLLCSAMGHEMMMTNEDNAEHVLWRINGSTVWWRWLRRFALHCVERCGAMV